MPQPASKGRAIAGPHSYQQIPALVDRKQDARHQFLCRP